MALAGEITGSPEGNLEWKINSFSSLGSSIVYYSPTFDFAGEIWRLRMNQCRPREIENNSILRMGPSRPHFPRETEDNSILLSLERSRNGGSPMCVEYTFSIKAQGGSEYNVTRNTEEFLHKKYSLSIHIPLGYQRLPELVPDNRITVLFRLRRIHPTTKRDAVVSRPLGFDLLGSTVPKNKILQDFKQMFLNQEDCDVVIRVKDREFKAHSVILKARSPVLASALQSDMKEKATGIVEIDDLDPSVFSDFLCFLYCEEVDSLSEGNVLGLYTAADKYDVPDLRAKCVGFMKRTLCVNTFCDVIRRALLHSETDLIDYCTYFFTMNASSIVQTVEWQTFNAENPTKSYELLMEFATSAEVKSSKRIKLSNE